MTVLEVIQKSTEFLANKGVESPRLQTELLLAHVLKLPRMKLYLNFERALANGELDAVRELVKRRGQREPLQHITGSNSFCGLEISVNRHVLVPRPETELLAEAGWEFLSTIGLPPSIAGMPSRATPASSLSSPKGGEGRGEEAADLPRQIPSPQPSPRSGGARESESGVNTRPTALDFGTGSGCIAIALAAKCPTARVTALDVSPDALAVARQNAAANQVSDRIEFLQGDGFRALPAEARFDLIISNPPYIPTGEIASLDPEVRDFDPRGALDGGADGLDFYRRLAAEAGPFLKPAGQIMLELGDGQAGDVKKILETQKWVVAAVREDYTRRQRVLIARRD